jgi:hypothetical protein
MYSISCGPSTNDNEDIDGNNKSGHFKEIINLDIDSLSVNHTKAFEQRAIQKLQDLKDYIEILSDPQIDTVFKNQASEMAGDLFSSKDNNIAFPLIENSDIEPLKIDSFFITLKNSAYGKLTLEIHNTSVINKIEKLGNSEYNGAIQFRLFVLTGQKTYKMDMRCKIIVKKVKKEFGKESKQVWEVFLGDILRVP